ncbi:MAG TPA: hypothetical protein VFM37_16390 [Pseudonocardiaceae bacterium]|nr:hypothetical protein [Pseudonocardiaceae bacterium]
MSSTWLAVVILVPLVVAGVSIALVALAVRGTFSRAGRGPWRRG